MKSQLSIEQNILPTKVVLKNTLGESYLVFKELMGIITNKKYRLVKECGHYNDGIFWLCKVYYKKKTVFWLSILDNYFKIGFYFTKRRGQRIAELDIDNNLKKDFGRNSKIGRLTLLVVNMQRKEQIDDVIKIIEYKMGLKKLMHCSI